MKLVIEFYAEGNEAKICNAIVGSVIEDIVKGNGSIINVIQIPDDTLVIKGNMMCDTPEILAELYHMSRPIEIPSFMQEKRK